MSQSPFIDGRSPRPGGKESDSAKKEWEQTEKPKKLIGFVLLLVVVAVVVVGMAIVMNSMGDDEGEEEVTDKSRWLTLTNATDSLAWVDCVIGDPDEGGMKFSKKLSPKQETLVELAALPVACSAQDENGTKYWSWRGLRYGSPEAGIEIEVKRRDDPPKEAPPKDEGEEG